MSYPADSFHPAHLWFSFSGRSRRIPAFLGLFGANVLSRLVFYPVALAVHPLAGLLCSTPFIGMSLAVYAKRYRDAGLPEWAMVFPVCMVGTSFLRAFGAASFSHWVARVQVPLPVLLLTTLVVVGPLFLPSREDPQAV